MITVLFVEDNPAEIELAREAFSMSDNDVNLLVAEDGAEALAIILGQEAHQNKAVPDFIITDMNIPKIDGLELIKRVKSNPVTCTIPIMVLSGTDCKDEISQAYQAQANCMVKKPVGLINYFDLIETVEKFWLQMVRLPAKHSAA